MWCGGGRWILERGYYVVLVRAVGGNGGEKRGGGGWSWSGERACRGLRKGEGDGEGECWQLL